MQDIMSFYAGYRLTDPAWYSECREHVFGYCCVREGLCFLADRDTSDGTGVSNYCTTANTTISGGLLLALVCLAEFGSGLLFPPTAKDCNPFSPFLEMATILTPENQGSTNPVRCPTPAPWSVSSIGLGSLTN